MADKEKKPESKKKLPKGDSEVLEKERLLLKAYKEHKRHRDEIAKIHDLPIRDWMGSKEMEAEMDEDDTNFVDAFCVFCECSLAFTCTSLHCCAGFLKLPRKEEDDHTIR